MSLCNNCRTMDYAPCPMLEVMHDHGRIDPPVKHCKMKDYFDKVFDMMKESALHGAIRANRKVS